MNAERILVVDDDNDFPLAQVLDRVVDPVKMLLCHVGRSFHINPLSRSTDSVKPPVLRVLAA